MNEFMNEMNHKWQPIIFFMNSWMKEWINRFMNEIIKGWMNEKINEWINE